MTRDWVLWFVVVLLVAVAIVDGNRVDRLEDRPPLPMICRPVLDSPTGDRVCVAVEP